MSYLNLFAYTATNAGLPPYISVNVQEDGRVMITVRSSEAGGGGCGHAEIPRSEIPDLIRGLQAVCGTHQR